VVRRALGLGYKNNLNIEAEFHEKRAAEIHIDLKGIGIGYAWLLPHRDYTSIGLGNPERFCTGNELNEKFTQFCVRTGVDKKGLKIRAMPLNFRYDGFRFGNVFLAGDAAGFACPLTGEGIYQAMLSGKMVSKLILDDGYNFRKDLYELRRYHRYGHLLHLFDVLPYDLAVKIASFALKLTYYPLHSGFLQKALQSFYF